MRKQVLILSFGLWVVSHTMFAQQPVIFSVDRSSAAKNGLVTLHGSDFGNDPAQVKVFFGGTKAEIKSIQNQLILVRTPFAATFDPIRVTNLASGLTAYAPGQFFINYGGEHGVASTNFSAQSDFQAQSGLYDLCLCDFNDDNKVDVATASNSSNLVTVFQNASTPGNIALTPKDFLVNAHTLHVKCGDLNGDGKSDIVLSEGSDGNRIFILRNNGSFSFSLQSITLSGIKVKQVAVHDLDTDGRPEIIVTNTGGNVVTILRNESNGSAIVFSAPLSLALGQALSTDAIAIGDLNHDGLPEIVTSQYQADSENKLFIAVNRGSFNFDEIKIIAVNKAISSIRIADVDSDSKPDIVVARLTGSDISVYLNDTGTDISFRQPLFFITEALPVGMDFADFDGDGKLDMAVGSIAKSISLLNNTSTAAGAGAFSPAVKLNVAYVNRNVRCSDMDGDGKPDIIFTSIDDFSGVPVPASKVSVIRNLSCMVPKISPEGPLTICNGNALQLKATSGGDIIYQWHKTGSVLPQKSGGEDFLDITDSGEYSVTVLSGSGSCSRESNLVQVTVTTPSIGLTQSNSDARSNSPVCADNTLVLQVNDMGATQYRWRGPDGFLSAVTTPALERPGFSLQSAGLYTVDIFAGNCVAKSDSTLVESVTIPDFNLAFSGEFFCSGSTETVSINPALGSGVTYQWYTQTNGTIPGATADSYTASGSGEYYAIVTPENAGCEPKQTPSVTLTALAQPVANFSLPASGCAGAAIAFTQQSTADQAGTLVSSWAFGDGKTSAEGNPQNSYRDAGTFDVTLRVSYKEVESCSSSISKPIDIVTPVTPQITATATSLCPGESIALSVDGIFTTLLWSNAATSSQIYIDSPGAYAVQTVDENGCAAEGQLFIGSKPVPVLTLSADRQAIAAGQSVQLNAAGADTYSWSPGKTLNDSTISNPIASPLESTTYVSTGSLTDGCSSTASLAIQVSGEVVNIRVPVLFSPNGDGVNETLVIDGAENYPDCSLNVFDKRGGKVFSTTGYQNNWDGTFKGTVLPEGVYYYVFGCPNKKALTGPVTILH